MHFSNDLIVWSTLEFIISIAGLFVAYKINFNKSIELVSVVIAGFLISISLVYTLPRAESQMKVTEIKYPYHALISLSTFIILTLYNFIKDALVLMDDNILIPCDAINLHTTLTIHQDRIPSNKSHFRLKDHVIDLVYFIVFFFESIMIGMHYGSIPSLATGDQLLVIIRFVEFGILGRFFIKCNFSRFVYWTLSLLYSIIVPISAILGCAYPHFPGFKHLYCIASSLMFSVYLYVGASEIQNGFSGSLNTSYAIIIGLLISLAFPLLVRIGGNTL